MPIYLDCAATTPLEPEVRETVLRHLEDDIGNSASLTHEHGLRARRAVELARERIARVVHAKADEVVFTSGATESNNLAVFGLLELAERTGRKHVVSTAIEHSSVLSPLAELKGRGFEVTLVAPTPGGWVSAASIESALRPETLLVSVMHVNNETGTIQPLEPITAVLRDHPAYLHVDAAQGLAHDVESVRSPRIDMISVSGHKIHAPQGIGALIVRRRGLERVPIRPRLFGGGHERGLRAGTLPVALVAGLGAAADILVRDIEPRRAACLRFAESMRALLSPLSIVEHGDSLVRAPHILNFRIPDVGAEALLLAWKDLLAASKGSACASGKRGPSHVLRAMGLDEEALSGAVRLSWCHRTPPVDWYAALQAVRSLRR